MLMVYGCNDIDSNSSLVGHGGSDGLHGYVPSLDHVVADTVSPAFCVCSSSHLGFVICLLWC